MVRVRGRGRSHVAYGHETVLSSPWVANKDSEDGLGDEKACGVVPCGVVPRRVCGKARYPRLESLRLKNRALKGCGCRELEPGRSCCQLVLVNEASEQVASADLAKVDSGPVPRWYRAGGWALIERAVRPMGVVVLGVDPEHAREVQTAEEEQPVQAFPPEGAEPSFHDGVRPRRSDRGS